MPRFVFELEQLLEHRLQQERERQRHVAVIEQERLAIEYRLRTAQELIEECKLDLRAHLSGPDHDAALVDRLIDPVAVRAQAGRSLHLVLSAQRTAIELAGALQRVRSARADLLEATKRRKAVELLKKRRYERWRRDMERRENAFLDELAVMRAGREDFF